MSENNQKPGLERVARLLSGAPDVAKKLEASTIGKFKCPRCGSIGFMPSIAGVGCDFCDGTMNGEGPDPSVRYLHIKSGRTYDLICTALHEATGEVLVIYSVNDELGVSIWARPYLEFFDGRFQPVAPNDGNEAFAEKHQAQDARLLAALGALTNPEGQFSCIPPGPERDELQAVYDDILKS